MGTSIIQQMCLSTFLGTDHSCILQMITVVSGRSRISGYWKRSPPWLGLVPRLPWIRPWLWIPIPLWEQSSRLVSSPLQPTSSREMGPIPGPKLSPISGPNLLSVWLLLHLQAKLNNKVGISLCIHVYITPNNNDTRGTWFTTSKYSKLSAHHHCISVIPSIITHCPPTSSLADLHPSFILIAAIHQSHIRVVTNWVWNKTNESMKIRFQTIKSCKWFEGSGSSATHEMIKIMQRGT